MERPICSGWAAISRGSSATAHRHALHDLDPVAGGVLRRQERERRAGAGAEARHLAVIDDVRAVEVGGQRHRLPDAHVRELRLLEIGIHPHLIERHDRHQRRPGADALPELHVAAGDEARHRRRQLGAREREVGVAHRGGRIAHLGMILERRVVDARAVGGQLLLRRERGPPGRPCTASVACCSSSPDTAPEAPRRWRRARSLCAAVRSVWRTCTAASQLRSWWQRDCAHRAPYAPAAPRPDPAPLWRRPGPGAPAPGRPSRTGYRRRLSPRPCRRSAA